MIEPRLTSIIMVSYHTGEALDDAIAAALAQTADVELVLVNNGNPPEVEADLIARFKDEPLVRLLTGHGNIGFSRACNLAARMAQGERLLFLAPDALMPPDLVAHLMRQEAALKRPFMLGVRQVDGQGRDVAGSRRAILTPWTAFLEYFLPRGLCADKRLSRHDAPLPRGLSLAPALPRSFFYIPREDFLAQGFDERFFLDGADHDFSLLFRLRGGQIAFDPDPLAAVRRLVSPSRIGIWRREALAAEGLSRYFRKHFRRSALSEPMLWLLAAGLWLRAGWRGLKRAVL